MLHTLRLFRNFLYTIEGERGVINKAPGERSYTVLVQTRYKRDITRTYEVAAVRTSHVGGPNPCGGLDRGGALDRGGGLDLSGGLYRSGNPDCRGGGQNRGGGPDRGGGSKSSGGLDLRCHLNFGILIYMDFL